MIPHELLSGNSSKGLAGDRQFVKPGPNHLDEVVARLAEVDKAAGVIDRKTRMRMAETVVDRMQQSGELSPAQVQWHRQQGVSDTYNGTFMNTSAFRGSRNSTAPAGSSSAHRFHLRGTDIPIRPNPLSRLRGGRSVASGIAPLRQPWMAI